MNRLFAAFFLFFSFSAPLAAQPSVGAGGAREMKRIAFSVKDGVEVFAESVNGKWCENILTLKVFAQSEDAFSPSVFERVMDKVGVVLENECSAAEQCLIDGYSGKNLVFQGGAEKSERWKPEKGALKVRIRRIQAAAVNQTGSNRARVWTPSVGKQRIEAHIDPSATEYRLYSKDKACSILYTSANPENRMSKWSIVAGGNSCADNLIYGRADVTVFDENGSFVETLDGYFTEGRFTGRRNLNIVLLNRYGYGRNNQNISYLIDTDPELKISYVGYLKAPYNGRTKRYQFWQGCQPFTVAAVAENEEVFLNETVAQNIARTVQSYADIFCPSATRLRFFATTAAQNIAGMDLPDDAKTGNDEALIYTLNMKRNIGKKWEVDKDDSKRLLRMRETERQADKLRENQLMTADYNDLLKSDYLGRLAYMIGADSIENPDEMFWAAKLTGEPVRVNILARVVQTGFSSAFADWPERFKITETDGVLTGGGWYLLNGFFRVASDDEARRDKVRAVLELSVATKCEVEACGEVSDLAELVRRRFERPDWHPYQSKGETP